MTEVSQRAMGRRQGSRRSRAIQKPWSDDRLVRFEDILPRRDRCAMVTTRGFGKPRVMGELGVCAGGSSLGESAFVCVVARGLVAARARARLSRSRVFLRSRSASVSGRRMLLRVEAGVFFQAVRRAAGSVSSLFHSAGGGRSGTTISDSELVHMEIILTKSMFSTFALLMSKIQEAEVDPRSGSRGSSKMRLARKIHNAAYEEYRKCGS